MKIAMPLNEKSDKSDICPSFGRAPYYLIYDNDNKTYEIIYNEATNSAGGAGIKAAQFLVDKNINVLIAQRCGENAAKVLYDADIILYKNIDGSWEDNIQAFVKGGLESLKDIHPGFHNHGAK